MTETSRATLETAVLGPGPGVRPVVALGAAALLGVAWLSAFPPATRHDRVDILGEAAYFLAVATAYRYIARFHAPLLEAGWLTFAASLLCEVLDEFTEEPPFFGDWLSAGMGIAGLAMVVIGFRQAARRVGAEAGERRRAEEGTRSARLAAEEANVRLQESIRLKDDVVSIVAHDFRSPLTVIQGYGESLRARVVDPAAAEQLDVITGQARYLARLAEDTLVMSRLESGELPLNRAEVDLVVLTREALAARGEDGARLQAEGPVIVDADPQRMRQVLDNLLDNAAKYAPRGAAVQVRVGGDEDSAYLTVTDRGAGIAAADLPRMFEKFTRLESARASGIPGSGLGLYICRSIVEAHGGRIHVESAIDHGSTFTVRMPRGGSGRP